MTLNEKFMALYKFFELPCLILLGILFSHSFDGILGSHSVRVRMAKRVPDGRNDGCEMRRFRLEF